MKKYQNIIFAFALILLLNFLSGFFNLKLDLTEDHRFSISKTSKEVIAAIDKPVQVMVFLEGNFPSYFKKLRNETENLLQQFNNINSNIDYVFIDPLEKEDSYLDELKQKGLTPAQISIQKGGKLEQVLIYPWAVLKQSKQEIKIPLLTKSRSNNIEQQIQKSIESLEYALVNGIHQIKQEKKQKIAVLKGNGELDDLHLADFLMSLGKKYRLAPFTLDSVATNPVKTLDDLQFYDLAILAKPTEKFTEKEKFVIDQFLMNGGKMLMLIDAVKAHKDTLMYRGKTYALNAELNLTDLLFSYGVRIKPELVKDLIAAPVTLKIGQVGNQPQLDQFPWFYSPLASPNQKTPIGKNLDLIMLDFVSPMDTLKNHIKKTILLSSSSGTQLIGVPTDISFDEIGKKPDVKTFNHGKQILGVLLEGYFKSAYNRRIKPIDTDKTKEQGKTALIVIADGDIIKNQIDKGKPLELGFDKWSKIKFDNKKFLINAIDYLMDKNGIISLKEKVVKLKFLDKNKIISELGKWQLINTVLPLLVIMLFGFGFNLYRKKKYNK